MLFTKKQKNIDTVLSTFTQALQDLEEIKNNHEEEASKVSVQVEKLLSLKEEHQSNLQRAEAVMDNIKKLIGV